MARLEVRTLSAAPHTWSLNPIFQDVASDLVLQLFRDFRHVEGCLVLVAFQAGHYSVGLAKASLTKYCLVITRPLDGERSDWCRKGRPPFLGACHCLSKVSLATVALSGQVEVIDIAVNMAVDCLPAITPAGNVATRRVKIPRTAAEIWTAHCVLNPR